MVRLHARRLSLTPPRLHPLATAPKPTTAAVVDAATLSLALMHSDNSFSLYPPQALTLISNPPSLSPSISLLPPQTTVPPPCSSAAFVRIHHHRRRRLIFLTSSPHLSGAAVLLRFFSLSKSKPYSYSKTRVICNQKDLSFDEKFGLIFGVNHGGGLKIVGSVNMFVMYSETNSKVWVFAVKLEDGDVLKVMRTAVIECSLPVFTMSVLNGFLMLGEENGVRVFALRPLVKGGQDKKDDKLSNGVVRSGSRSKGMSSLGNGRVDSNGCLKEKVAKDSENVQLKSVKLRQDSREGGMGFVSFERVNSTEVPLESIKAISIQVLCSNKFLVLDSVGDMHVLSLSNSVFVSEIPIHMKKLTVPMKVQTLAVLPDTNSSSQTVWISDGNYTLYIMVVSDKDSSDDETIGEDSEGKCGKDNEEKHQISAIQAIFACEKIQELLPLAANEILMLGQGNNIFTYAIS